MDFGEVLTKSWKVIWKHKILWLFGFLASCGSGGGGGGGSGTNYSTSSSGSGALPQGWESFISQAGAFFEDIPPYVYIIFAVVIFLLVIIIPILAMAIASLGRVGLVKGAWQADEGTDKLTLGVLFRQSTPYFLRVFLMYLALGALVLLLVLAVIIPFALIGILTMGIGLICLVPLLCLGICVLVPLSWAVEVLTKLAVAAMVGEELGLVAGVKRAWAVAKVKTNLGSLALMAVILLFGGGIARLIIGLPFLVILIPIAAGALAGTLAGSGVTMTAGIVIGIALFLLYLPVALLLGGVLESYIWSAWTLTFRRIRGSEIATASE